MTKKSIFDKLFESVINEDDAELKELGIDTSGEGAPGGMDDLGSAEDSDSVTFTLDRATAKALCDVLQGALGEAEGEDEMGGEDEGGELEGEMGGEEDEETLSNSVPKMTGKSNKAGGSEVQPKSGKADHTYTDEIEGGKEHNTKPAVDKLTGKNNKVDTSLKVGKSLFSQ